MSHNRMTFEEITKLVAETRNLPDAFTVENDAIDFEPLCSAVGQLQATLAERDRTTADLVEAARNMMREWIEVIGNEKQNSTPGDILENLRAAIDATETEEPHPSGELELSGRPAKQFVWTISERQFQLIQQDGRGNSVLMAESSSMFTFCKCMSDMMAACGKTVEFEVKHTELQ